MSLQERINEIGDYFRGIESYNDALIVKAAFPPAVTVMGNDEKGIKVTQSEDGLWYYYGNKNSLNIEDVFDLIKTTVYVYEEAKKKADLYKQKCEELKNLFGVTPYEELVTIQFVTKKKKKPKKSKKVSEAENNTENAN